MIKIPKHPWWKPNPALNSNYREAFSRLTEAVQSTCPCQGRLELVNPVPSDSRVLKPLLAPFTALLLGFSA
jgi:hypothetical protein